MNTKNRKPNAPLIAPLSSSEQNKKKVSKALKAKLLTILCRELNEELNIIKQTKAAQIKNQKAIRVQSIKNKRKKTTEILPSKRFKMLQTVNKSKSSAETRRIDPFARRKVRANPANIFQMKTNTKRPSSSANSSTNDSHNSDNKSVSQTEAKVVYNNTPITNDMTEQSIHKLVILKLIQAFRVNIKKGWEKMLNKICTDIENNLSKGFNGCKSNQYRNRFRTILFNLRRNKELCMKLLSNQVSAEDLALRMSTLEMSSLKKQMEIKEQVKELQRKMQIKDDGLPWGDEISMACTKCFKVGHVVSYSIEASVNSKSDIWAGSSNDISGIQYKCKSCGSRWSSNDDK